MERPTFTKYEEFFRVEAFCRCDCEDDRYMYSAKEFLFTRDRAKDSQKKAASHDSNITHESDKFGSLSLYPEYYK